METKNILPFSKELLAEMLEGGFINKQSHPSFDLFIYNYSEKAQYDRVWNEATLHCRGLIVDAYDNLVARPFKKFFNYGEQAIDLPLESFDVLEKMDGSLGILYWYADKPYIATRGSFASDQAIKATEILHNNYANAIPKLDKAKTYLFEIIYPENRIVVNYGLEEKLVLLAIIDNTTGNDDSLVDIGFPLVPKYDGVTDFTLLKNLNLENKEGFVIKYSNGYRIKLKFEEYLRLHRIITMVSEKTILEYLSEGVAFDAILEKVPDEFYAWVHSTIDKFNTAFKTIEEEAKADFKTFDTRKEAAAYYMTCKFPTILFHMLDGKNYDDVIWKIVKQTTIHPS